MSDETPSNDELIQRFIDTQPRFQQAADDVVEALKDILGAGSIYAAVSSRVKEIDSFRGKVELRDDYTDPWAQITDKVGARALVHRADEVDRIHRLIEADGRLQVYGITDKRLQVGERELAYSGLHLDIYAPSRDGDQEQIPVEIQIRTIAQHAWSEVSHRLVYKPQAELDADDRRAIWRLVALVELFDGEVSRVMEKLPEDAPAEELADRLATHDLPDALAANYARFEGNTGNADLTRRVCGALAEAIPAEDHRQYDSVLGSWVTEQKNWLRAMYDDYGPRSSMATVSDYVLWSQPESIGVLEALSSRPWALVTAWRNHGLPDRWLKPLEAVGTDVDLDL
ncbi:RelA/SpoT domain-containing protein [Nocardioides carbamazepini]|uniref:GTP pyrophosphokinase n=1 Tax=Nocardioides carbamazepini TaxID=2854259 RepID=UPI00214A14F0|nr:RelA/SpoT domain-containing protein [Nocardioides carbamazepini]MCR1784747.1 RelA/SpoT domain-containing protein [Nocardioides carbamazepini]